MLKWLYQSVVSLTFRTQLILMVLLLSLPAVGLIIHSASVQRRDALREGISETKMLVHIILTEQRNITNDAEQLVTAIAQLPAVREHRVDETNAALSSILKLNHEYSNLMIADRSGKVWASALPFSRKISQKGSRAFDNAVRSGRFSSGEYGVGKISGRPNISFGYPIRGAGGAVEGVIVTSLDLGSLNDVLTQNGLPPGSSFTLTDYRGVIIYRNQPSAGSIGAPLAEATFLRMKQGSDQVSLLDMGLTDDEITSYGRLRLRGEGWPYLYVKGGIPLGQAAARARRAELVNIAILSPILVVAVLLAALLGKFCFVNRIKTLQQASQRLAAGDLGTRVSDLVSGGELGELGHSFDVMAQQLAAREAELAKRRAELEDLYNNAPCGYHSLDAHGTFVRVNDTELAWLGYRREEVVGTRMFADLVTPEGRERYREGFRLLKERGWVSDLEYDLVRSDGSVMPVLLNAIAVRSPDGTFLASRATIYDITERKQAVRELNELNLSLSQRVEEEAGRRIQQERLLARHARLAAMGEMIGAIAHQWRQPLAALGATIQSLRMAWERRVLDAEFLECAEEDAQKQLYYMSDTIEDFRNFFTPEKVAESFDVKEKIHEVSQLVAARFANSGVTLELLDEAPGAPLRIRGYQNEFKQSVLNLVSNAFDAVITAGEEGGEPGSGRVVIAMARGPEQVVVEVRDNGCGIASDIAGRIWEPYFTSKPEGKGTGIGLYMSKLIIEESMGGSLGFRSLPQGTVFTILLPEERHGEVCDA